MQQDGLEAPAPTGGATPAAFRLAVVPGVNPARWLRVWEQRLPDVPIVLVPVAAAEAEGLLRADGADAGLVRVPVDRDVLSAIPLYTETSVVVVPTDHLVTAADEITAADLAGDVLLVPGDDVLGWAQPPGEPSALPAPATTAEAVELVAAGVGVLAVPQSLARLHHRRDLTYRPVTDAPTSSVGLAWVTDRASDLVEELVGIVRGRTANSSRGRAAGDRAGAGDGDRTGAPRTGAAPARPGRPATGASGRGTGGSPRGGRPGGTRGGSGGGSRGGSGGGRKGGSGRGGTGRPR